MVSNIYARLGKRITQEFHRSLEAESIILDSKRIWLTAEAMNIKGKGLFISRSKQILRGQLIITRQRFIAIARGYKIIDIPRTHNRYNDLIIDTSNPKRYTVSLDLGKLSDKFTGRISLSYHISPALLEEATCHN